jgi:hypothetical protein
MASSQRCPGRPCDNLRSIVAGRRPGRRWRFGVAPPAPWGPLLAPTRYRNPGPDPAVPERQRTDQHRHERRSEPQADREGGEPGREPDRGERHGEDPAAPPQFCSLSRRTSPQRVRRHFAATSACRPERLLPPGHSAESDDELRG